MTVEGGHIELVFFLNYVFQGAGFSIAPNFDQASNDPLRSKSRSDQADDVIISDKAAQLGTIINIIDALQDEEIDEAIEALQSLKAKKFAKKPKKDQKVK